MKTKIILLSVFILSSIMLRAQYVAIPDENFEQALIDLEIDTNPTIDHQVLQTAVELLDSLEVDGYDILNLTGIEAFINLTMLYCPDNRLNSIDLSYNTKLKYLLCHNNELIDLDLSSNTALEYLHCDGNQLTSLNVTQNSVLQSIYCEGNELPSLNVSNNIALVGLNCNNNKLTSLDLSNNTELVGLTCSDNLLTILDVRNGNNSNFYKFEALNNNLVCISVDDETANHSSWLVDPGVIFSNDCDNTPVGDAVVVQPVDATTGTTPIELTFENVSSDGQTTLVTDDTPPAIPDGFAFGDPPTYFDITTTAEFSGNIQIAFDYSGMTFADENALSLMHYVGGEWKDVTTTRDTNNDIIYGEVSSFSGFAVLQDIQPPEIVDIFVSSAPVALGMPVSVSLTYNDNNLNSAMINWGDGSDLEQGSVDGQTVSWNYTYLNPGVYTLTFQLIDQGGNVVDKVYQFIVIYDPSGGFVTGGGWIYSPPGAYIADPLIEGKADFKFDAKYKKAPKHKKGHKHKKWKKHENEGYELEGKTDFKFKAGKLDFKSTSYDWLVVTEDKAIYKGVGKINRIGGYQFIASVLTRETKKDKDKFRIRIWTDGDVLVYDNQMYAGIDADALAAISKGKIHIHKAKKGKGKGKGKKNARISAELVLADEILENVIEVYPNPFDKTFIVNYSGDSGANHVTLTMVDILGRKIYTKSFDPEMQKELSIDLDGQHIKEGLYFIYLDDGIESKIFKMIKK